jgi:hypothetical protein
LWIRTHSHVYANAHILYAFFNKCLQLGILLSVHKSFKVVVCDDFVYRWPGGWLILRPKTQSYPTSGTFGCRYVKPAAAVPIKTPPALSGTCVAKSIQRTSCTYVHYMTGQDAVSMRAMTQPHCTCCEARYDSMIAFTTRTI